jgi:hypothetical protein
LTPPFSAIINGFPVNVILEPGRAAGALMEMLLSETVK